MKNVNPKGTSTPHMVTTRSRRGIHETDDSIQSPIKANASEKIYELNEKNSAKESDSELSNEESSPYHSRENISRNSKSSRLSEHSSSHLENYHEAEKLQNLSTPNYSFTGVIYVAIAIAIGVIALVFIMSTSATTSEKAANNCISINQLRKDSTIVDKNFWNIIQSSVSEIVNFNKPSVILFVYENENDMSILLKNISSYASCQLNNNVKSPIFMSSQDFNKPNYMEDYGRAIYDIKPKLEEANVLVVEDIDNINGVVAQAFHTLCDEYSPLVENSLFLFTIKGNSRTQLSNFVTKHLHSKWSTIDEDKIEPLLTRITNMVVKV